MFGGIDTTVAGLVLGLVSGVGSFMLGRRWRARRKERERAARQKTESAGQSRQVRRANRRSGRP